MTVIFRDVHAKDNVRDKLKHNRVLGALFDEILYADDTIIFSEDAAALEELLHAIEEEGGKYGMKSNKKKCEHMCVRASDIVKFKDAGSVPPHDESKYLGCMLNDKATLKEK